MTRILVIEDNDGFAYGLRNNLEIEGHVTERVRDGVEGLRCAAARGFDLIILDLMLPGLDGYRVLQRLRAQGDMTPVLILSARGEEIDKVRGFRFGADDYVTKPFGVLELMARIEALLRRAGGATVATPAKGYVFGGIEVDPRARTVTRDGHGVDLAPLEFDLLLALLRRDGAAATRLELLREVWGHAGCVLTRTVDTHVAQLRRKLETEPARPAHILTVRKVGYRVQA
ncbi:MAG: response regulator transcription factor [Planctomycetota bacterium]